MPILGFEWDEANLRHIALHSVTPEEAEEVLLGLTREVDSYELNGEDRLEEVGITLAGRISKDGDDRSRWAGSRGNRFRCSQS